MLALARAFAGETLPIDAVVPILPGADSLVTLLALIKSSTGQRSEALIELVRKNGLPVGNVRHDAVAFVLYVAWRLRDGDEIRKQIAPPLRMLLRRQRNPRALALLARVVRELDDPNVTSMAEDIVPAFLLDHDATLELTGALDQLLAESARDLAKDIPAAEPRPRTPGGITIRAAPKPGRNDICPCGSGKKYKRCCQDRQEVNFSPSPVAGMSWEEFLQQTPDLLSDDALHALSLRDIALLNMRAMDRTSLSAVLGRTIRSRRWDLAARVIGAMAAQPKDGPALASFFREELIRALISCAEFELARAHSDRCEGGDGDGPLLGQRAALALAQGSSTSGVLLLQAAERAVLQEHLREDHDRFEMGLAFALLDCVPALGILVARGCLKHDRPGDSEGLLEAIEEARDRLNLPPGDPAWDSWSAMVEGDLEPKGADDEDVEEEDDENALPIAMPLAGRAPEAAPTEFHSRSSLSLERGTTERGEEEVKALQTALRESAARMGELERQLKASQATASPGPTVAPTAPALDVSTRRLHMKIDELKARIDDGNEERRELRRKLAAASRTRATNDEPTPTTPQVKVDGEVGVPVEVEERRVLAPSVARRAADALRTVQSHVAAEAMRTVGSLCAADRAPWNRVKRAKDMRFPLLMARVGIHHRLLFRADEGVLEVLDLVTRENLDTTLKRLRST
jgi:hypothetical protein